jgi:hypothetical protein
MDQIKNHNFKRWKFQKIIIFHDDGNFEYCSLLRQLNEEKIFTFDDIMHKKQLYLDTFICLFLTKGVGIGITFTLKFINQRLSWLI